jgi:putative transposase
MSSVVDYTGLENIKSKSKKVTSRKLNTCLSCDSETDPSNRFFCLYHFEKQQHSTMCNAIKKNNKKCPYKASYKGFCNHHITNPNLVQKPKIITESSRVIKLQPSLSQIGLFKKWFGVARLCYNTGNHFLKKKKTNLSEVRDFTLKHLDTLHTYCKQVPSKIKQGALEDLTKARNNAYEKYLKTKQFQKCKMKRKFVASQSINIAFDAIKLQGKTSLSLYPQRTQELLGINEKTIECNEVLPEIFKCCRLIMRHNKYFYLSIPQVLPQYTEQAKTNVLVGCDPGIRTFNSFYSPTLSGQLGMKPSIRLNKSFKESDLIKSKIDRLKLQKKHVTDHKKKILIKKIKQLRKKYLSALTKPKRLVKEMHNKIALFLCKNFKTISIPEFSSKDVADNLYKTINRTNQALSHFSFRQILIHKAKQWKRKVHFVSEEYTSCTCTRCGFVNQRNKEEYLTCERCKLHYHRDIMGARNILIKTVDTFNSLST